MRELKDGDRVKLIKIYEWQREHFAATPDKEYVITLDGDSRMIRLKNPGDLLGFYTYKEEVKLIEPIPATPPVTTNFLAPMSYREEVLRTGLRDMTPVQDRFHTTSVLMTNAAMGLAGESGEFLGLIYKSLFYGAELDKDKAIKELGDIRWFLELAAHCLGVSMEEVERRNVEKLRVRFPTGFTEADAAARVDTNVPTTAIGFPNGSSVVLKNTAGEDDYK